MTTDLGTKSLEIKAAGNAKLRARFVETPIAKREKPETNEFDWDLPADAPAPAMHPKT